MSHGLVHYDENYFFHAAPGSAMDYYTELLFAERIRSLTIERLMSSMPPGLSTEQQRMYIDQEFAATAAVITDEIKKVATLIRTHH